MDRNRTCLYVAVLFFVLGTIYGLYAYQHQQFPYTSFRLVFDPPTQQPDRPPTWDFSVDRGSDTHWKTRVQSTNQPGAENNFKGLGYLKGYEEASNLSGTVTNDTPLTYRGLNLFVSGHGPEAILMDMTGNILHRWRIPFSKAFPENHDDISSATDRDDYLRKFHVFPNGDIIVNFEWLGLVKLNRDSEILWSRFNRAHHDLWIGSSGQIYVLTAKIKDVPLRGRTRERVVDSITVLGPDGTRRREISLYEAIKKSAYSSILNLTDPNRRKLLHTNSLEVFTEDHPELGPAFSRGNALISMRNTNTVAVVDLEQHKVVWSLAGPFEGQHDPVLLDNDNLLVFDNWGHRGYSKVIELDPRTQTIQWAYYGDESNQFASKCCGTNQRLPNGNTLITDTSHGRSFEVTPEGKVVWEFYNPFRTGEDDQQVASLFALKRFARSYFTGWIASDASNAAPNSP